MSNYVSCRACDRCASERRKTINGEDVLFAMQALGFDQYIAPLQTFLQEYRDVRSTTTPHSTHCTPSRFPSFSALQFGYSLLHLHLFLFSNHNRK